MTPFNLTAVVSPLHALSLVLETIPSTSESHVTGASIVGGAGDDSINIDITTAAGLQRKYERYEHLLLRIWWW